jgi:siroheme synthase-like protein
MDDTPALAGVPVLLHAARLRVLSVGGGVVATGKLRGLLDGGAQVRVVAPTLAPELQARVERDRVTWLPRAYAPGDIGAEHVVIAGTDDPAVNATVAAHADAAGRVCIRVDDGASGTGAMMAGVRRGPLVFGVATGGAPALTRLLRQELEHRYGPEHGELARLCADLRADPEVAAALGELDAAARRERWRAVYHPDILDDIRAGRLDQAKEAAFACLLSSSD